MLYLTRTADLVRRCLSLFWPLIVDVDAALLLLFVCRIRHKIRALTTNSDLSSLTDGSTSTTLHFLKAEDN